MNKHAEAIWKLLWDYIANEDADEDYSEKMAERLCECILPQVWSHVANMERLITQLESTISGYEAVMKAREKLDDLAK